MSKHSGREMVLLVRTPLKLGGRLNKEDRKAEKT